MADILVVDDDESTASAFRQFLGFEGHACRIASDAGEAARQIAQARPDLVVMDIRMPGPSGLDALVKFRSEFPGLCIVLMTAYGTSQTSIAAIRAGAFDYLMKPLDLNDLRQVIDKALDAQRAVTTFERPNYPPAAGLIGSHPSMVDVYKMIGRLATNRVPALIVGERGTGKRLVVATIHDQSDCRDQPLIAIDCGTVADAELDERLAEAADGTIALRHVDRLAPALQTRVAQRLASDRTRGTPPRAGARVLATTEHDLGEGARSGRFGRELFDEISVITLHLIPLRERAADIPALVAHFIHLSAGEVGRPIRGVDDRAMALLTARPWPGNVGELERAVRHAVIVARADVITADEIESGLRDRPPAAGHVASDLARSARQALHDRLAQPARAGSAYHEIIEVAETALVDEALRLTHGNQVRAADILGVNRATLRKKMPAD